MARKPIQTWYAGCHFRSRLEARWAVFFDAAGIPWEYEPEGFDIDGTWYLPDFRLPQCGTWIEVKGILRLEDELLLQKAVGELPHHSGHVGECGPPLMVVGTIPEIVLDDRYGDARDFAWGIPAAYERAGFGLYHKNKRPWWDYSGGNAPLNEAIISDDESMRDNIEAAYRKARAARFEHGQKG